MLLRELNRCKSAVGGSLENKYRCYLLAELTITKQSFASPPPSLRHVFALDGFEPPGVGDGPFLLLLFFVWRGGGCFFVFVFPKAEAASRVRVHLL